MRNVSAGPLSLWAILIFASAAVPGASWRPVNAGLPVATHGVRTLVFDPVTPSTVYALTATGSLFKSTDAGGRWDAINGASGVNSLVVDPQRSILYAATRTGSVLKSVDGGETWVGANNGLPADRYWWSLIVDPMKPSTLYLTDYLSLFKSMDGGQSWNALDGKFYSSADATIPLASVNVFVYAIDPKNSSNLYAAAQSYSQYFLFKSTDAGKTWYPVATDVSAYAYARPQFDPWGTLYLWYTDFNFQTKAGKEQLLKSTDGAASFSPIGDGIPNNANLQSLAFDPASPSTIYANYISESGWGAIKSTDGGKSWGKLDTGLPPYVTDSVVAVSPTSPSTVFAGYADTGRGRGRLVKSADGGASWSAADGGLTYINVQALAIGPGNSSVVYIGMGDGQGVFKSTDAGTNWSSTGQLPIINGSTDSYPETNAVNLLLIDFANPDILYAGVGEGYASIFKSVDGAANWTSIRNIPHFLYTPPVMLPDPSDANDVYFAGLGDCEGAFLDRSTDGGVTWTNLSNRFGLAVNALTIDAHSPTNLFAAMPEGVVKSVDGGKSWSKTGMSMAANALAMDPADSNILFVATGDAFFNSISGGVFKSTDGGATWAPINNGLEAVIDKHSLFTALLIAPDDSKIVYAAASGDGVFKSIDGGTTWTPLNAGLANLDVRVLAIGSGGPNRRSPPEGILYAVTSGGVFRLFDDVVRQRK